MQTQCGAKQLEFSCVERRRVVPAFDGGDRSFALRQRQSCPLMAEPAARYYLKSEQKMTSERLLEARLLSGFPCAPSFWAAGRDIAVHPGRVRRDPRDRH